MEIGLFKKACIFLLALAAVFFFIVAIWGGLIRIGWTLPVLFPGLPGIHGPLIVCGFLGVLFGLERAVAVKKSQAYLMPFLIGIGAFFLILSPMGRFPQYTVFLGSIGFLIQCGIVFVLQRNLFNTFYFLGSFLWVAGIIVWMLHWPVFYVYLWWMGFVLFVLVGQRLEVAHRIQMNKTPQWMLGLALGLVFLGMICMAIGHFRFPESVMEIRNDAIYDSRVVLGMKSAGIGMFLSAAWLLKYDATWSLMGSGGVSSYATLCYVSAYGWLAFCGVFSYVFSGHVSGMRYDALLHSFFIGFDWFIMFGHGPILCFTLLGVRLKKIMPLFFYLIFLHLTLIIRLGADVTGMYELKKWGGLLNGFIFLFFFIHVGITAYVLKWRQKNEAHAIGC